MLTEILNSIMLFGGGLALLLAVVQLFHDRSKIKNILLFAIFLSLGIIHIYEYGLSVSSQYNNNHIAHNIFLLAKYILGPSMYVLYMAIFSKNFRLSASIIWHFTPAFFVFILILFESFSKNSSGIIYSIRFYITELSVFQYLHSFGFALIFVYICAILMKLDISVLRRDRSNRLLVVGATTMIMLLAIIILIILSLVFDNRNFSIIALTLTTFFFIYWFVVVQIYPELFSSSIKKKKKPSRNDDSFLNFDIDELEQKISELMEKEKLFCDEDITIKKIADILSINPNQLSFYLNHNLGINFNTFINQYRVKEAINMMREDDKRSLLSIAFSAGFNSKSAFYEAFTRETGMSPAKYRKLLSSKKS